MKADVDKEEVANKGKGKRKKGKKGENAGAVEPIEEQSKDVSRLLRYSINEDMPNESLTDADDNNPNPKAKNKKKMKMVRKKTATKKLMTLGNCRI